jgi:hypothetical protein
MPFLSAADPAEPRRDKGSAEGEEGVKMLSRSAPQIPNL